MFGKAREFMPFIGLTPATDNTDRVSTLLRFQIDFCHWQTRANATNTQAIIASRRANAQQRIRNSKDGNRITNDPSLTPRDIWTKHDDHFAQTIDQLGALANHEVLRRLD
jgi:hypothetical protein